MRGATVIDGVRHMGPPERAFAWVVAVVAALSAAFWSTSAAMVAVWSNSNTYSHGFFIVPAFLWLVWGRRHTLACLPVRPTWWALPVLAAIGLIWLVGHWMALALPSQLALVAMVPAALAGLFGVAWVRALLFPLAFLFFAVPFGDSLVPVLMDWTADFTVWALRLTGVPVYRDGLHFDIPSGKWSVVDSCSGIRYLFACLAVSSLYAWTIYRATARRLMFLGFALVIAIVANWVRAYAIVLLGHLSNNQIAAGADHLVYGAVFFAVIMALIFTLGAMWRESPPAAAKPNDDAGNAARSLLDASDASVAPRAVVALVVSATVLVWPALSIGSAWKAEQQVSLAAPDTRPRGDWVSMQQPLASWRPVLSNPASASSQTFAKGNQMVGLHIGLFGPSTAESKLTAATNRLLERDGLNRQWRLAQQGQAPTHWNNQALDVRTAVLIGSDTRLLAWQWYWVDGTVTADPLRASALQLMARLRGRSEVSAWIAGYARDTDEPGAAAGTLQAFMADMSASIDTALRESSAQSVAVNSPASSR